MVAKVSASKGESLAVDQIILEFADERMTTRPFKVLGIQQIAIGGPSKERLRTLWVDKLGLEVTGTFRQRARERRRGHLRDGQRRRSRSRST